MRSIDRHFSTIAPNYRKLRETELEPISYIGNELNKLPKVVAADIGCGSGRYSLKLFQYMGNKLHLFCIDCNKKMLEQLDEYLTRHNIKNFYIKHTLAKNIPLPDESLDGVVTFNAIHHFKIFTFFKEAKRVLKNGGYLFVYTRTRSQNGRNIWGKFFPLFCEKETRLYEIDELSNIIQKFPELKLQKIKIFKFKKSANLGSLLKLARNHHYSTFFLYSKREFKKSLEKFKENLQKHFTDLYNIIWFNENVLFVVRKQTA